MFPGQGAQYVGMGKTLHDGNHAARLMYAQAANVLGEGFVNTCFCGPEERLTATDYCQPALFVHSCAVVKMMQGLYPEKRCDIAWGLSLGELSALHIAGVFDFETGVRVVHERGRLMQLACERTDGTMASLIGGFFDDIVELCDQSGVEIANINCPGQVVISGDKGCMKHATEIASKMSFKRIIPLKVAGAYHSKLMAEASAGFEKFLNDIEFSDPVIPVISNVTADFVKSAIDAKQLLVKQITSPVLFGKCCERAIRSGVDQMFECGAGRVLTGLMKRIDASIMVKSLDNLSDFNL